MVQKPRQNIKMIEVGRIKFFGHIFCHKTSIINILEGEKRKRTTTTHIWGV